MPFYIQTTGSTLFPNRQGVQAPFAGLRWFSDLVGSTTTGASSPPSGALSNLFNSGEALSIGGNPTWDADGANCNGFTNYLQFPPAITDTPTMTLFGVFYAASGSLFAGTSTRPEFLSNFGVNAAAATAYGFATSTSFGIKLGCNGVPASKTAPEAYLDFAEAVQTTATPTVINTQHAQIDIPDMTQPFFGAAAVDADTTQNSWYGKAGAMLTATVAPTAGRARILNPNAFRVGGYLSNAAPFKARYVGLALLDKGSSVAALYAWLLAYQAARYPALSAF